MRGKRERAIRPRGVARRRPNEKKMVAEYLDKAITLEKMADEEKDANLKASLERLAMDYRKLADERATRLGLSKPPAKSD
jgi:predicted aminopeptidase